MSTPLAVVNIAREAERLKKPFQVLRLEQVDDLAIEVYLCQGVVAWHRHVDEDELFMTFSGLMTLESEWGTVTLRPWEMALVPKGIRHRSLAAWPSLVLLVRPVVLEDKKNGHRRLFGLPGEDRLRKTSLVGSLEWPGMPFRPQFLLQVEGFALRLLRCVGQGPWNEQRPGDALLMVQHGTLLLESGDQQASLVSGELVRVPKHRQYRLTTDSIATVLELVRDQRMQLEATSYTE